MSAVAVLKAFAVSPDRRAKKLTADIEAVDRKIEKTAGHAAELQAALDDGDGDAAAIVATAATLATARAERVVLVGALESAQRIVREAEAEEERRQAAVQHAKLRAEAEAAGKDLEAALFAVCAPLGRFNALVDQLDNDRPKLGIEDYCLAASATACKDVPKWPARGNPRGDKWTFDFRLTVPVGQVSVNPLGK